MTRQRNLSRRKPIHGFTSEAEPVTADRVFLDVGGGPMLMAPTNMPGVFPAEIDAAAFSGAPTRSGLSDDEKVAYERLRFVYQKGIAYGFQMGLRPQTLCGIADSPVGLAAYFLDHQL